MKYISNRISFRLEIFYYFSLLKIIKLWNIIYLSKNSVAYNIRVICLKKLVFIFAPLVICIVVFMSSFFYSANVKTSKGNVSTNSFPVIIIDAGHGGFDGGAVSVDGTAEKEINLAVAKYLREYLALFGFKTVMTREDDTSIEDDGIETIRSKKTSDLHNRMKIMEETDNSIFVSIHQNKFSVEKYSGTQVFYSPGTSDESIVLAQCIQDTVKNTLQPENTRVITECGASVFLIYKAVKPAVLVECGFLSNNEEARKLSTEEYQKQMALCIAVGIQNYITSRNE